MKTRLQTMLAAMIVAAMVPAVQAAPEGWTVDFAAAKQVAAKDGKDLFLEFTGSDWCPPCIALKADIFDAEHFAKESPNYFVLVKLDFPNDKSHQTEAEIAQNKELQATYGISGYPTVVLTDAAGRPYAKMVGYGKGSTTPEKYIENLREMQQIREKRDAIFAKAESAKGIAKAKALDEALNSIDAELASCIAYKAEMEQIIKLDADNAAGLKAKYETVLMTKEVTEALAAIQSKNRGNAEAAVKAIDELIASKKLTGTLKQEALFTKGAVQFSGDQAVGLATLQEAYKAAPDTQKGKQIVSILKRNNVEVESVN